MSIEENNELLDRASLFSQAGFQKIDSLHIACATTAMCDYFLTTDDKILSKTNMVTDVKIIDPIGFVKEVLA